jgi:hypothetical protein
MKVGGERIRATKQMTAPSGSQSPPQGSKRRQPRFPLLVSAAKPNMGTHSGQCRMPSDRGGVIISMLHVLEHRANG